MDSKIEIIAKPVLNKFAKEVIGPDGHFWRFPAGFSPNDLEKMLAAEFRQLNLRFVRKSVWWAEDFSTDEGPCYSWLVSHASTSDEVSYFPNGGKFKWASWEPAVSDHVAKQAASVMKSITEAETQPVKPEGGGLQLRNDVFLPNGTKIKANYHAKRKGAITVRGEIESGMIRTGDGDNLKWYKTLSAAATGVTGATAINGWAFWKIYRAGDARWVDAKVLQKQGQARIKNGTAAR